ncbi:MAG: efflux RND transporter periplasmic adaptor subunit [Hyphomicrobiales bacterium]|nr:efflux RND transporter periplasmic adaptor subunit [Hyphomicrobiales bacterium]
MRSFVLLSARVLPALVIAATASLAQAEGPPTTPPARPAISVTTAPVKLSSLPYQIDSIGSVQPVAAVQLRTRVDAQIEKIAVADGATVKQGDLLVKLDSRQISAQLKQAEAQLARDQAQLEQNLRDVARYAALVEKRATPQINLDNAKTATLTTKAAIAGDEAAIDNLKVQLTYYALTAPISGKVGTFSLKAGNMARAGDNTPTGVLVTLNQVAPIYVAFSVPQRYLPELRASMKTGGALVQARPQGLNRWIDGKVAVLDNTIDPSTGMLVARAEFANADEALWPGQLCDLRVQFRVDDNLVTVPREAVQIGQKGSYVFVVDGGVAKLRPVKTSRVQAGLAIIEAGTSPGETVVVEGANLLTDGAPIMVRASEKKPSAS